MGDKEYVRLQYEVEILSNLDHPNILRLYETYNDEKRKKFYLVTEKCEGGELFDVIMDRGSSGLTEQESAIIMKQILSAVNYCHLMKVAHRDLKPENILLENPDDLTTIKIIDFGTSQVFTEDQSMSQTYGTPYYIAPEVCRKDYDQQCDIWSIGVILYILMCGEPPFNGRTDADIIAAAKKGKYNYRQEIWKTRSPEVRNLIDSMLTYDPKKRITAKAALEHPWIVKKTHTELNKDEGKLKKVFENLSRFQTSQKLQQAALTYIVCQLTSKNEMKELQQTFNDIDKNNDGTVSKDEMFQAYKIIMGS